ncbi:MAG: HDIG domain-containing protein [Fimbriimonadaceae bacterium]|nr:HDIG domain-containing protein [Fimbriimonadaceae bacterium]
MAGKQPPRRAAPSRWSRLWSALRARLPRRVSLRRLFIATFCIVGYTALLEADLFRGGIAWQDGELADRDIVADRTVEYLDEEATAELRAAARQAVPRQYDALPVEDTARERVVEVFNQAAAAAGDPDLDAAARAALIRGRTLWVDLPPGVPERLAALPAPRREALADTATQVLRQVYGSGSQRREIRDDVVADVHAARTAVAALVEAQAGADAAWLTSLLTRPEVLRPNRRHNRDATDQARDAAAAAVEPVRRSISRGQVIIERGHPVTAEVLRDLRALGLATSQRDWRGLFALASVVCLMLLVLGLYIRLELPEIWFDNHKLLLLNLVVVLALVLFRLMLWLRNGIPSMAHPAILCGATTGMIVAVLIEYRLAMMMTGTLALLLGMLYPDAGLWVAFEAWLAGRVGAMALRHVKDRNDLARAGFATALAGMLIAAVVQLPLAGDPAVFRAEHLIVDLLFGFAWGMLAFLLAQGMIPLLERPFGCITPFRLLDLTNTSTVLLQRLKREARGTFDASLTIGDMAADACEVIGADPLLARTCGYYHDIGKLRHPTWFVENQFGAANVHDTLEPTLSALAIKSHVSEGFELAREHGLPRPVQDVIAQHHGTTLISFFYFQALERAEDEERVTEEQFRYDGPRPQFKESGVLMLADGIEAEVRAASRRGPLGERKIHEIVHNQIRKRLDEGQLDECDLTLRDLHQIEAAFCDYLRGMYHNRIDYPSPALRARAARSSQGGGDRAAAG